MLLLSIHYKDVHKQKGSILPTLSFLPPALSPHEVFRSSGFFVFLRRLAVFISVAVLFALIYTQFPLYSSNQNQYFLHGLAASGAGLLHADWLANTLDPTPVFSAVVWITHGIFRLDFLFYAYYAILIGVYLFSVLSIIDGIYHFRNSRIVIFLFLLLIHSALLRFGFSRLLGPEWKYVLEGGVAGQRILGSVLEPSSFGVFLILSVALFLKRKPIFSVLSAVLAATVHPTYLLGAGTLTGAYLVIMCLEAMRQRGSMRGAEFRRIVLTAWLALIAVLPIVAYVLINFIFRSSGNNLQAQDILVHFRIPHHAVVSEWFDATTVIQLILVLASLWFARRTRLFPILAISTLVAVTLTLLQLFSEDNTLALLFPWRLSVFIVPLSCSFLLGKAVAWVFQFPCLQTDHFPVALSLCGGLLLACLIIAGLVRTYLDFNNQRIKPERPMMAFVEGIRTPNQVFLIPIKMEDFRLVTGAPVFVDHKSIPYLDTEVLEWYRRVIINRDFVNHPSCNAVDALHKEGVTHMVIPSSDAMADCQMLRELYRDDSYVVYRVISSSRGVPPDSDL